jgi:hypothetical protein
MIWALILRKLRVFWSDSIRTKNSVWCIVVFFAKVLRYRLDSSVCYKFCCVRCDCFDYVRVRTRLFRNFMKYRDVFFLWCKRWDRLSIENRFRSFRDRSVHDVYADFRAFSSDLFTSLSFDILSWFWKESSSTSLLRWLHMRKIDHLLNFSYSTDNALSCDLDSELCVRCYSFRLTIYSMRLKLYWTFLIDVECSSEIEKNT